MKINLCTYLIQAFCGNIKLTLRIHNQITDNRHAMYSATANIGTVIRNTLGEI